MSKITVTDVVKLFNKGFDKSSIKKFNNFLKERGEDILYYNAVVRNFNGGYSPDEQLINKVQCAFRDEAELGSCFVDFDESLEGRKFWNKFNADWQTYRKNDLICT